MNLATTKRKSETQGQKFIQVFPGNKKTMNKLGGKPQFWVWAAWTQLTLRIAKKVV